MIDQVLRAIDLLIKSGELGAADSRSLNLLAQHLDPQGETDREAMIELLFSGSKDPDGTCRSFLSRLKAGAAQAADKAERQSDGKAAAMFRSITVARIKAKGGAAALLRPSTQGAAAGDRPGQSGLSAGRIPAQHRLQTGKAASAPAAGIKPEAGTG